MSNLTFILYVLLSLSIASIPLIFKKLKSEKFFSILFDLASFSVLLIALRENYLFHNSKITPYFALTSFLAFFTWFNLVIKISLVRSLLVSKTALATLILITLIALLLGLSFQEELMSLF